MVTKSEGTSRGMRRWMRTAQCPKCGRKVRFSIKPEYIGVGVVPPLCPDCGVRMERKV